MGASAAAISVGLGIAGWLRPWQGAAGALVDIDFEHRRYSTGNSRHSSEAAFLAAAGAVRNGSAIIVGPATIGAELVVNGDFSANIAGWSAVQNSPALSWNAGKLRMTSTLASGQDRFSAPVAVTTSKAYRFSSGSFATSNGQSVIACFSNQVGLSGPGITLDSGIFSRTGGAIADTMYVGGVCATGGIGQWCEFDNLSIKEVVPIVGHNYLALSGIVSGTTPAAASGSKVAFQADDAAIANGLIGERNRVRLEWDASKHLRFIVTFGGTEVANLDLGVVEVSTAFEVKFSATSNSFKASLNGGVLLTDTSGTMPGIACYRIGRSNTGEAWDGTITRVRLFSAAMSDADMTDPLKAFAIYGDSTSKGDGGTGARWWQQLATGYDPDRSAYNAGVSGQGFVALRDGLLADTEHRRWTTIIMDRPNSGEAAVDWIAAIKAALANLTTDRWLVMPPVDDVPGMPGYTTNSSGPTITAVQQALLSDPFFLGHTLDASAQATYLATLVDAGKRTDGIHFNDAGQTVQAAAVRAFMDSRGW